MTAEPASFPEPTAVPPKLAGRRRSAMVSALGLGAAVLALGVLFAVDPARHQIYPTCLFYATTGLLCPGCRGLRATHQLLHGHLAAAWTLNPLAVLLVPLGLWYGLDLALALVRGHGLPHGTPRPLVIWLGLAGLLVFTVLRNLS
ncbi:MAG TPA: DUF2752 domain-containing protein [Opitutaceae bacterium]|nr:DUF2752 domain-containing protein [Opitutaceae bacterium]